MPRDGDAHSALGPLPSLSNQENAPTDMPVGQVMEKILQLRVRLPRCADQLTTKANYGILYQSHPTDRILENVTLNEEQMTGIINLVYLTTCVPWFK